MIGVSRFVADCLRDQRVVARRRFAFCISSTPIASLPTPGCGPKFAAGSSADGRFVLLTTAYLIKAKGVDVAVRALAALPDAVTLWVVGDGPESAALRALAAELGLQDRIYFLGLQSQVEAVHAGGGRFCLPVAVGGSGWPGQHRGPGVRLACAGVPRRRHS